jgi:hypothetical protein
MVEWTAQTYIGVFVLTSIYLLVMGTMLFGLGRLSDWIDRHFDH